MKWEPDKPLTGSQEHPDADKLRKLADQTKRQISRLIDAYGDGLIGKNEFEPRIQSARARLERLKSDISSQRQQDQQISELRLVIGHLQLFAKRLQQRLTELTESDRREILRTLIRRIEVGSEEIRIVYRVDCIPIAPAPDWDSVQDCRQRLSRAVSSAWTKRV